MKTEDAVILSNEPIAADVYCMRLSRSGGGPVSCGQFFQVQVPGYFLRRPISVCEADENELVLVYKVTGDGTEAMSRMAAGETVNLFGPLGTGFPVEDRDVVLIGGGVGVPPLVQTAKEYRRKGRAVTVCLGFLNRDAVILTERFEQLGCRVITATDDGSEGIHGTVMDALREEDTDGRLILACGPKGMLKAVSAVYADGYISLEERMACGMGACMGCVVKDRDGNVLRVCSDGPVFPIGKVVL